MSSVLLSRPTVIIPVTGTDLTDKEGYLLMSDGAGGFAVVNSASTPAVAVVLSGAPAAQQSSVGLLGSLPGSVRLKSSGTIQKWDRLKEASDGTVVADASGSERVVVGTALESAVSGDLFEAMTTFPVLQSNTYTEAAP